DAGVLRGGVPAWPRHAVRVPARGGGKSPVTVSCHAMTNYLGTPDYAHGTPARTGVLLVNLGTPDEPTTSAVRRYLAEFLWDPRVIEQPRALWWLILHGIILRTRPAKSAHAYQKVWTPAGSPLLVESRALTDGLAAKLRDLFGDRVRV